MCIGIPMQVIETGRGRALCRDGNSQSWVDTRLVDGADTGTWLLVFAGAAREIISSERAAQVAAAVQALQASAQGDTDAIDALFADLVNREPTLPPHLQPEVEKNKDHL